MRDTTERPEGVTAGTVRLVGTDAKTIVAEVTRLLTDEAYEPNALVAVRNGSLVGLVHFLEHRHCWKTENVIYLQDLFAAPTARGLGVGRALIEAVYDIADQTAAGTVYWTTENTNETAMRLYDKLATRTKFIKYQR